MPEKVYVKSPWEYLSAYKNGTSHIFLYYEGDTDELPVYFAQKSAEGDPYAMYLYSRHYFRLSVEHFVKKLKDRTLGRDEYGPKGFVYLRAAAEAGVPDAVKEYEEQKQRYTFPMFQDTLPELNPYNDYINEKLRYEKIQKEKAPSQPLDYNDYINQKMRKVAAEKAMKKGQPQPSIPAVTATKPTTTKPATATKPAEPKPTTATKSTAPKPVEKPTKSAASKPAVAAEQPAPPKQKETDTAKVDRATKAEKPKYTPEEIYNTAVAFYRGEGVEQDYETARKLFQKAAEQGVVFAMLNCGVCYEFGQGCQQDYGMAMQYYNAAAEQGNAKALWRAGWLEAVFFEHHETGVALMEKAFEKGAVDAAFDLGQVYSAKNPCFSIEKAVYWYETSITAEGNQKAYSQLGRLYEKNVKTDDGKRKAIEWYEKAYQNGDKKLCTTIGLLYRDIEEYDVAYEWLRKGQLAGDVWAVEMMKILDNNRCPHCRAIYSKTYKKGLFGEKCVCSKCGKKIKEEE